MIVQLPPDMAVEMWPVLAPLFKRVTDTSNGCYEPADILREILNGKQTLWVAWDVESARVDAAVTTTFIDYPRKRVCRVAFVAGNKLRVWLPELTGLIEKYAVDNHATALEGGHRRGWAKVWPGARETGANLFKDL